MNGDKPGTFPLVSGQSQGSPHPQLFLNIFLEVLNNAIQKQRKFVNVGRKDIKLCLELT